jgi:rod shape-determining protein MreC
VNVLRSRAVVVILILLLVLVWLVFDRTGAPNPVRDTFSRVLAPMQYVLHGLSSPVVQAVTWVSHLGRLEGENDTLRQENIALRSQIMLLQEAQIENETLRRQLNFKSASPNYRLLSAEVIGHDPTNLLRYLIIDRGASDEIRPGMPVLTAEGLVGRVAQVSASSSQVMLITDPSSSVSAIIQRSRATGIVQGYPGDELVMRYIPQGDTVTRGDVVTTSGLGGNFPKRLVIGQVASVERKDVDMFQEARLIPAVNLRALESVMVLLSFTPIEYVGEGDK